MTSTWKTYDETWHGSKWGYVVVAAVILIVLSLLGSIFYLIGQGIKGTGIDAAAVFTWTGIGAIILFLIIVIALKAGILAMATLMGALGHVHGFLNIFWVLFKNVYILAVASVLVVALILALAGSAVAGIDISLTNPLVIGLLIVLLIIFFPLAIFLVDLFSYEHE